MAVQLSEAVRNGRLNQVESVAGTAAKLYLRTGTQPANCGAADSGSLLVTMDLPSDWMNDASGGQKTKLGTWTGTATGAGTIGHFRIKDSTGTTCHVQGSVTVTAGGGDMTVDNTSVEVDQVVNVTLFTLTDANS